MEACLRDASERKSLNEAETIRSRLHLSWGSRPDDKREHTRQMIFVLMGADTKGVELDASIGHLALVTLHRSVHNTDPTKSKIVLLDGGSRGTTAFATAF